MNATDAAKISLLISDVDDTLVTPDKTLTLRALAAVRALAEARIRFASTTDEAGHDDHAATETPC